MQNMLASTDNPSNLPFLGWGMALHEGAQGNAADVHIWWCGYLVDVTCGL